MSFIFSEKFTCSTVIWKVHFLLTCKVSFKYMHRYLCGSGLLLRSRYTIFLQNSLNKGVMPTIHRHCFGHNPSNSKLHRQHHRKLIHCFMLTSFENKNIQTCYINLCYSFAICYPFIVSGCAYINRYCQSFSVKIANTFQVWPCRV